MKGVGRIYQQTFVDTYSKVAFAKLYDRKTPNGGIALHGIHPRSTPKRTNLSTGRLLRRPAQHNAGVPVAGFVTALHSLGFRPPQKHALPASAATPTRSTLRRAS